MIPSVVHLFSSYTLPSALSDIDKLLRTPDNGSMAALGFTAEQLVALAHQAGYADVTVRKIERMHKEDVLPRPSQEHVPGIKGSVSVGYPPGTDRYLLAACRLLKQKERYNNARFEMWLEGFAIPPKAVREALKRLVSPSKQLQSLRKQYPDPFAAAEEAAAKAMPVTSSKRADPPIIRFVKRNLSNDGDTYSAVTTVLRLAFGDKPDWGAVDVGGEANARSLGELLFDGWGLQAARTDSAEGIDPWLSEGPESVPVMFRKLKKGGFGDVLRIGDLIDKAGDDELDQARHTARVIFEGLPVIAETIYLIYGRDFGGFGIFRVLRPALRQTRIRAYMVPALIAIGRVIPARQIRRFTEGVAYYAPRFEAMLALVTAVPESRPYMRPGGWLAFTALPDEHQKQIADKTKAFLAANPPFAAILQDQAQAEK